MICLQFPLAPRRTRAALASRFGDGDATYTKAVIGLMLLVGVILVVGCAGSDEVIEGEVVEQANDVSDNPIVEIARSGGGTATLQLAQGALWICGLAIAPNYLSWKYNFVITGLSVGATTQFESDGQASQSDFPINVVWDGALRTFNLVDTFRVSAIRSPRTINITADPPISVATIRETVGDWAVACEPI